MDKNEQMAKSILKAVGGTENIKAATHCMTRLRLSLKDDKIPVDDEIKNIDGVIGVNRTETQFQIIIGPSVAKVYEAVCKQGELNSISETSEAGKEETDAGTIVDNSKIDFTIRWCKKAAVLDSTHYRVEFDGELYDIKAVDHMNFKRKCIKLSCQKVRR